ncbi:MAG: glycosyltransferase family 1 protein [Patescibacteria group bacterium]
MKIVIDARIYGPEFGGLGRYNQAFLENLSLQDHLNEYIVLLQEVPKDHNWPSNWQIKICTYHWYSWQEQVFLPLLLKRLKPDLVHFTHFNVPIFYRGKFIVTIHDLIMTKFPSQRASTLNRLMFKLKRIGYQLAIKQAVLKAQKIIAVSQFTARDIKEYFELTTQQAKKIAVIYEGVSLVPAEGGAVTNLPKKFFLYVGNTYPHKNLEFLIKTFKDWLKIYPDYYLYLLGSRNYFYNRLEAWAKDFMAGQSDRVVFTGFVPDSELTHYYQAATAYIFPSLYEGFGLPPLEACAHGLPVLASQSSCLPEILAEAALYFDPKNQTDLLNKMEIIVKSNDLRARLKERGLEQIKKYSWQKMAFSIRELYLSLK